MVYIILSVKELLIWAKKLKIAPAEREKISR